MVTMIEQRETNEMEGMVEGKTEIHFYKGNFSLHYLRSGVARIHDRETNRLVWIGMKSQVTQKPAFIIVRKDDQ